MSGFYVSLCWCSQGLSERNIRMTEVYFQQHITPQHSVGLNNLLDLLKWGNLCLWKFFISPSLRWYGGCIILCGSTIMSFANVTLARKNLLMIKSFCHSSDYSCAITIRIINSESFCNHAARQIDDLTFKYPHIFWQNLLYWMKLSKSFTYVYDFHVHRMVNGDWW